MKKLFVSSSIIFVILLTFTFYLLPKTVRAANAVPAPVPFDCNSDTGNGPEFASDRPYQGSVCGDRPITYWCGNDVVIDLGNVKTKYCDRASGQLTECPANIDRQQKIDVDLTNVQLPILGNTQLTANSTNPTDQIDEGTKVSNYVAWYLQGTNDRAEYGGVDPTSANAIAKLVDTAGPIKKLLPSILLDATRITTINNASTNVTSDNPDSEENNSPTTQTISAPENHNQIVVCYKKQVQVLPFWLSNFLHISGGLGKAQAVPCYEGGGVNGSIFRLKSWDNSPAEDIAAAVGNWVISNHLYPAGVINDIIASAADRWPKKIPPLPWSNQFGRPFATDIDYQKAYREWKGDICALINVPVLGQQLVCIGIPGVTDSDFAQLYPFIPLANTTDKQSSHLVVNTHISHPKVPDDGFSCPGDVCYIILHSPGLKLPHTAEDFELSNELKSTYVPATKSATIKVGYPGATLPNDVENNKECRIIPSETNSGDDVVFDNHPSHIEVDVQYHVSIIECTDIHFVEPNDCDPTDTGCRAGRGYWDANCSSEIYATVNTIGKFAYADEIWNNTVAGSDSIFRRIYPKVGANAPVSCLADTPASSNATYTLSSAASPELALLRVEEPDKSVVKGSDKQIDAQLYYPHFGGVLEYFLNGIQQALRPQGYGPGTPESGQYCTNLLCGELPKNLPKASGSCNLGQISSRVGQIPDSLKQIINAAAQTYHTPPNLILGIMYGEGLFDGTNKRNWTDTNVKNWATCQKVPNCHETGDDNFMGFNGNDFKNIAPHIINDLKKLDPSKSVATLSQCNLMDAIYAEAYNLNASAAGGGGLPTTCFGIPLSSTIPTSCSWNNSQYEDAIKVAETGYTSACLTLENGCAIGGGLSAACPNGDSCETITNRYSAPSHNACVWDVGHGF